MSPRNLAPILIGASNQIRLSVVTVHEVEWILVSRWEARGADWQEVGHPVSVPLGQAVDLASRILEVVGVAEGRAA